MLDFLLTTDVGRRVPGVEEEDAVSAVSELEVREWLEEQGAGAEEQDAGGELPLFLRTPDFMTAAGESRRTGCASPLFLPFVIFLGCGYSLSGQAWAEGKGMLATSRHCADCGEETDCT